MSEMDLVDLVNAASLLAFWMLLLVGTASTLARVAYYRAHGFRRPKLLVRDVVFVGGFSLSFGLILGARVARAAGADTSGLATSLPWTLATALPAIVAVLVYAYFELVVIERGGDALRDEAYRIPSDDAGTTDD